MSAVAMTPEQNRRFRELYRKAFVALESLSEERLNLAADTRAALDKTRGSLELTDAFRLMQPTTEGGRP